MDDSSDRTGQVEQQEGSWLRRRRGTARRAQRETNAKWLCAILRTALERAPSISRKAAKVAESEEAPAPKVATAPAAAPVDPLDHLLADGDEIPLGAAIGFALDDAARRYHHFDLEFAIRSGAIKTKVC